MSAAAVISALAGSTALLAPATWGTFWARSRIWGEVVWRGSEKNRQVALTFDDGPRASSTERVLDILREHQTVATFFVIGTNAQAHPTIVRRIHAEGHGIGNHTWSHPLCAFWRWTSWWRDEIARTDDLVQELTGVRPKFFRPPLGYKTFCTMRAVRENGQTLVTWTRRPFDGLATTTELIVKRLSKTEGGEILLMHDGAPPGRPRHDPTPTVEALPQVIAGLQDRGLEFVRLEELVGAGWELITPKT